MGTQRNTPTLQDAIYELSLDSEIPTPDALERTVMRYPQFADDLTDFAISLVLGTGADGGRDNIETDAERDLVSRAMSHFQNGLYDLEHAPAAAKPVSAALDVANPFASLDKRGFRSLVSRLNASSIFVIKLRDRQIQPETIPPGCQRWLASKIGTTLEHLSAYLSLPPTVHADARYKADVKPAALEKQTFEQAVRTSGLTDEQQRQLLSR